MRHSSLLTLVALALLGWPSNAGAQERKGFWFDADFGAASISASANGTNGSRTSTGIFGLALGWAVTPRVLTGVDMRIVVLDVTGDVSGYADVYNVTARVMYYLRPSSGFFVKGTIGGSFIDFDIDAQGTRLTANVSKGLGLGAGVGYDWYLGRGFSLTPAVTYWYGRTGDVRYIGQTLFTDWSHNVVDATIGISFH